MTTVAFIGLGIMGGPMAGHLVTAGFDVVGYNRSQPKIDELVAAGGRGAGSVADAVRDADVVAVMVPDSPDVQQVLAGDGGVFENAQPGTLIIDFSSIRPDVTTALATQASERRACACWTPRSPAARRAPRRRSPVDHGRRRAPPTSRTPPPIFAAVGKTIVHVGPSGAGQTVKAANQLIVAGEHPSCSPRRWRSWRRTAWTPRPRCKVLGGGLAGSKVLDQKGAEHAGPVVPAGLPDRSCTTRISASSPPPPGRPGWSSRSARSSPS